MSMLSLLMRERVIAMTGQICSVSRADPNFQVKSIRTPRGSNSLNHRTCLEGFGLNQSRYPAASLYTFRRASLFLGKKSKKNNI